MRVEPISSERAMRLVLRHHYSRRKVGTKHAFGLVDKGELLGCCTFSIPASYTLCTGVCGPDYRTHVLELSRLVIVPRTKNLASMLIGTSLRRLGDFVVVSYADCNDHVGHVGYVYQATNWIYTGRGNAEPKWLHPTTGEVVSYTRRHIDIKAKKLGVEWTDLIRSPQLGKHRYVTFTGSRRFRKAARNALRYSVLPYPKGETCRHDRAESKGELFNG